MNINHAVKENIEGDRLIAIFNRQAELMEKYHHIEERSGLCQTTDCPVNIDDKRGQARIKDFAWRLTEEVGEALDALSHKEHYQEELIDGLHFLTELTILAGGIGVLDITDGYVDEDKLGTLYIESPNYQGVPEGVTAFITQLGMTCNCLKNKPWKQTSMLTDKKAFYVRLNNVWKCYVGILKVSGLDSDDIANIYLKKSQVNKFRIRSNY